MGIGVARYKREQLIGLQQRDALKRGTFTLASGRSSHYYVDGRKVTLSAEGAALVGAGVLELLDEHPEGSAACGGTLRGDARPRPPLALVRGPDPGRRCGRSLGQETLAS